MHHPGELAGTPIPVISVRPVVLAAPGRLDSK
jgi:hypothetical protein